jgi:serine/threonine-protein kinase RsbW
MKQSEPQHFSARRASLPLALAYVEAFCEQQGLAPADMLRLTLIVEELFTNTIVHGHRGESDAPVCIALGASETRMALYFEDNAPPFDPLRYLEATPLRLDSPADERQVGGLGLPLIAQMAEQFDYAFVDGVNRLYLVLKRGG